jgi:hypothetical protein
MNRDRKDVGFGMWKLETGMWKLEHGMLDVCGSAMLRLILKH